MMNDTKDTKLIFSHVFQFCMSSCILSKTKDSFLPCEAPALFQQVPVLYLAMSVGIAKRLFGESRSQDLSE